MEHQIIDHLLLEDKLKEISVKKWCVGSGTNRRILIVIFDFIEKLNELKTDNVEPLSSIAETKLRLRKDEVKSKNIREEILKNSPKENKDFFVVPKVVE